MFYILGLIFVMVQYQGSGFFWGQCRGPSQVSRGSRFKNIETNSNELI